MKANGELEATDIGIDFDIDIEGTKIQFYVETWFDVDKKFGTNTANNDNVWINVYGIYDVCAHQLVMHVRQEGPFYETQGDSSCSVPWNPTADEQRLIVAKLTEMCRNVYHCSPWGLIRSTE